MLVNIFDGVWNNGYLMPGGRNLIVGSSNGDIRQWKGYGWLGKLYPYSRTIFQLRKIPNMYMVYPLKTNFRLIKYDISILTEHI